MNVTLGTWFGESQKNDKVLYLEYLNGVRIKRDEKIILYATRTKFFLNPPTEDVQAMREILKLLNLELISSEDFRSCGRVIVKTSEPTTQVIQTNSGFMSEWIILYSGIQVGTIEEHGNFYDRGAGVIIDIPGDN